MRVRIDCDELYPHYFFPIDYGEEVEVPLEQYAEWQQALAAFERVQKEMQIACDAAYSRRHPRERLLEHGPTEREAKE